MTIALFVSAAVFANGEEVKTAKGPGGSGYTYCETSELKNSDGEVVASGTCCKTYANQLSVSGEVAERTRLAACAETARDLSYGFE